MKTPNKVVVKGIFVVPFMLITTDVGHTLIAEFKDGKARIIYTDLVLHSEYGECSFEIPKNIHKKIWVRTEERITASIAEIKKALNTSSDW
jgi:hypothetical protein